MTGPEAANAPVRCIDCGFLSKRVIGPARARAHQGFFALEPAEREEPALPFNIVPGEANAWMQGEYGCFQHRADFPAEITAAAVRERLEQQAAAHRVLFRERACNSWCRYEPGVDPAGHLQELKAHALERDRREFERTLAEFKTQLGDQEHRQNKRLARAAIAVTVVLGLVQLWTSAMATTPDAIGVRFVRWVVKMTERLF